MEKEALKMFEEMVEKAEFGIKLFKHNFMKGVKPLKSSQRKIIITKMTNVGLKYRLKSNIFKFIK